MRCRVCGAKLEEEWSYCPYCGTSKHSDGVEEILDMFEKSFKNVLGKSMSDFPFGKGFLVEISRRENEEPRISIKELGKNRPIEKKAMQNIKVVEPEVKVLDNGKFVKVFLPDIEDEKHIHIKKLQNSIEIRAHGKRKTYFTIIPNPNLTYKRFENGMLVLKFM